MPALFWDIHPTPRVQHLFCHTTDVLLAGDVGPCEHGTPSVTFDGFQYRGSVLWSSDPRWQHQPFGRECLGYTASNSTVPAGNDCDPALEFPHPYPSMATYRAELDQMASTASERTTSKR
jgi:hypothetical protein